jgi:hypothetical protein
MQSSANKRVLDVTDAGKSFMTTRKSSGPRTISHQPHAFNYTLKGHVLESVNTAKYLGITLSSNPLRNTTDPRHLTRNFTIKNYPLLPFVKESRDPIPDVSTDAIII